MSPLCSTMGPPILLPLISIVTRPRLVGAAGQCLGTKISLMGGVTVWPDHWSGTCPLSLVSVMTLAQWPPGHRDHKSGFWKITIQYFGMQSQTIGINSPAQQPTTPLTILNTKHFYCGQFLPGRGKICVTVGVTGWSVTRKLYHGTVRASRHLAPSSRHAENYSESVIQYNSEFRI